MVARAGSDTDLQATLFPRRRQIRKSRCIRAYRESLGWRGRGSSLRKGLSCEVQKQGRDLEQEAGYLVLVKIKPPLKPTATARSRGCPSAGDFGTSVLDPNRRGQHPPPSSCREIEETTVGQADRSVVI